MAEILSAGCIWTLVFVTQYDLFVSVTRHGGEVNILYTSWG